MTGAAIGLQGWTMIFDPRDNGSAQVTIRHGGTPLVMEWTPDELDDLSLMLARRPGAGTGIARTPGNATPATSGGNRPDGKSARAAALANVEKAGAA